MASGYVLENDVFSGLDGITDEITKMMNAFIKRIKPDTKRGLKNE